MSSVLRTEKHEVMVHPLHTLDDTPYTSYPLYVHGSCACLPSHCRQDREHGIYVHQRVPVGARSKAEPENSDLTDLLALGVHNRAALTIVKAAKGPGDSFVALLFLY